jgi:uncharacterized membrane protein (UPF0127 family)
VAFATFIPIAARVGLFCQRACRFPETSTMRLSRRGFLFTSTTIVLAPALARAQFLRPHEPLDPRKAQSLATSPMTIESGGKTYPFTVEVASTERQRDIGLMHRPTLAPDRGMLFDFHSEQDEHFWMRNTFIPLDMFFIRNSGEIIAVFQNAVPHSESPIGHDQRARAVLEVAGGTAARLGIKPGDIVHHAIFNNAPAGG